MAAQAADANEQNEQLRKAVEQALAASFVARRAKNDVAKDLLNKDRPPTADDIRQALEDGGWAKELRIKVHELHKQATTEKICGKRLTVWKRSNTRQRSLFCPELWETRTICRKTLSKN